MPTYDYVCAACGHALEIFQSMSEAPKRKCPKCGKSKLERRIGAGAGFLFKGSGFYLTDYRSKSYQEGAKSESKSETPAASESNSSDVAAKSDSKPVETKKPEARKSSESKTTKKRAD